MKRLLKRLSFIVCILLFSVTSCEQDDATRIAENEQSQKSDFVVKIENGTHLRSINPTIYKKLSAVSRAENSSKNADEVDTPNFSLDLSTIQIIERNTYTQYTTSVIDHAESETHLINYMLLDFNDGEEYQFLLKYPKLVTENGVELDRDHTIMESIAGNTLLEKSYPGGIRPCLEGTPVLVETTQEYQCTQYRCTGNGQHSMNQDGCLCQVTVNCMPASETCEWIIIDRWACSGGGTQGSGNGGGTTGGGNDSDDDDPIETVPFIPYWQRVVNCVNNGYIGSLDANNPLPLSSSDIDWLKTFVGGQSAIAITQYIEANGCEGNKKFLDEAIEALRDGGEVDFDEKIILDSSFTGKAKCIYNKMKDGSILTKALARFTDSKSKANLTFKLGDLGLTDRAITQWPDDNGTIVITLNNNNQPNSFKNVNFNPNLFVANTIIHEVIHAEFLRQILEEIGLGNLPNVTPEEAIASLENGDLHIIYEYFRTTKDWSHNYMADYYRGTFARATQEFDTGTVVPINEEPLQLYKDIAWLGLMNYPNQTPTIIAFQQLPTSEKNRILIVLNDLLENNANETCAE
ncbi:hypothetical protein [Kordia sp.]|uniref:hypothetical protein n=1 Tax=Kordia sp. TaxID=1965332 RepID=UPI003B5995D7